MQCDKLTYSEPVLVGFEDHENMQSVLGNRMPVASSSAAVDQYFEMARECVVEEKKSAWSLSLFADSSVSVRNFYFADRETFVDCGADVECGPRRREVAYRLEHAGF